MKLSRYLFLFVVAVILIACNRDKRGLSWNADFSVPLATTTLTLENFIADSLLEKSNGNMGVVYKSTLYELNKSLLFKIPDTTINYPFNGIPFVSLTFFPGDKIISPKEEVKLPTGQASISNMVIESGKLNYTLTSKITQPMVIDYSIPAAKKNNLPLSLTVEVPAAVNASSPSTVSGSIDLSDYSIDLTGEMHNAVNRVTSYMVIRLSANADTAIFDNTTTLNFAITFNQLKPYYAKGYFGQSTIKVGPAYADFDIVKKIKSGSFNLSKASCSLDIDNGIGVDAKLVINSLSTSSTVSTATKSLTHHLLNKKLSINRALDNPYQNSHYYIHLNETNSNIKDLIEVLPNKVGYEMQAEINPLGNISNGTDFIYSDKLLKATMLLRIPLNTKLNELVLQDTLRLNLNEEDIDLINYGTLKLYLKNYFNYRIKVNLFTINDDSTLGTLLSTDNYITPNAMNSNEKKLLEISLSKNTLNQLFSTKKVLLKITLDSNGEFVELTDKSRVEVEASADFQKTLHIK